MNAFHVGRALLAASLIIAAASMPHLATATPTSGAVPKPFDQKLCNSAVVSVLLHIEENGGIVKGHRIANLKPNVLKNASVIAACKTKAHALQGWAYAGTVTGGGNS